MNRKTLQKVLDELVKDKPDLSYARGILETILESLPNDDLKTFTINQIPPSATIHKPITLDPAMPPIPKGLEKIKSSVQLDT